MAERNIYIDCWYAMPWMKIIITRTLDTRELSEKIKILSGKRALLARDKVRLAEYQQAYRAYEESGEIFCGELLITELTLQEFRTVFTTKRMEILNYLDTGNFKSIAELSRFLKRNVKNVYEDLTILKKFGLVKLARSGKLCSPKLNVDSVSMDFLSR